jgi:hypothetical protein
VWPAVHAVLAVPRPSPRDVGGAAVAAARVLETYTQAIHGTGR